MNYQAIDAACNTNNLDGVNMTEFSDVLSTCRSLMTEFTDKSTNCRGMTESISNQCQCWSEVSVLMANIKTFNCKRIKETQKIVTKHKSACISVFSTCKKSEDHSVEAVYSCMNDHSMGFINQTLDTLGKTELSLHGCILRWGCLFWGGFEEFFQFLIFHPRYRF